jgi:hypothetical protein
MARLTNLTPASEDARVLFLHEVHEVRGSAEDDFEACFRDPGGWMDLIATDPTVPDRDAGRLLWYAAHAHGSGRSYRVVTITAVADGPTWERLARRIQVGDLRAWVAHLDTLRHDVTGTMLRPLPWSPLGDDLDLASVATRPGNHELSMYMEDTMWPYEGVLDDYIERAGTHYAALLDRPEALVSIEAAFQPVLGAGPRRQVSLLQKVRDPAGLLRLLTTEIPPERRAPGTWMHDALTLRDRWTSRLLRTSTWSPRW